MPVFTPKDLLYFTFRKKKQTYRIVYRNNKPYGNAFRKEAVEIVKVWHIVGVI